ncbi:ATP-binding cassette, subfamily B, bacterial [Ardenticatena maritima]|uniref:ATP-binding cassette, subfamily B, bacterial n=1 Tax=Ardenticatena maritima TaxID=872965 RepID=A0A0M8K9G4_9CHLR|nr:ABC transporter ATP-binding protein [Ardenticatena maritima]KPL86301.1 multidrug ABC transporter ATP-binding protein [Ardenticatena maritima]GAP63016.1 ATP-binding cassette, subfamily B, bacterial [Ardenticatena maritima]
MSQVRKEETRTAPPAPRGPMGHMAGMAPVAKPRDFGGTLRKLATYLTPYRWKIMVVFVLAIGSTAFAIVGPKILGRATTELFEGILAQLAGTGTVPFDTIGRILLIALGLYIFSAILSYLQGWLMTDVAVKVTYQLRRELMEKINRLPFRYFDGTTHGETLSLLTNDVDTINQTLNQSLTQIITSFVTVVGVLGMMLSISWQMTIVALLIVPLSMVVVMLIIRQSQKFFRQQQDYLGHVNGQVEETFSGHVIVKAFNGEEKSIRAFDTYNETLYGAAWKAQFFSSIMMPVMRLISNLGYVGVVVLGGWLAIRRTITVGDIQAFIQYVQSFTQPITQLANASNVLQGTIAAAERVFEFLELEEEEPDTESPVQIETVRGEVEFRNVVFGYEPGKPVIKGFSAHIQPGQKVAIVGPTGAGKTTLVKLLMRFYDVDEGAILIDGHDIRTFRRADLRRLFGMVLQDTWLFSGTIMENIRYGRPDATDEEVIAAAQAAHADHFIRTLPGGYHFELNEEVTNISQGQKQLITIARAILADPPMLILDEATSSVDTHTELLIQQAMDRLMEGRTSFVIAHRLSTIRNADLILVMRDGNIVEQGTHEELLRQGGFYAELYNSQFESVAAA